MIIRLSIERQTHHVPSRAMDGRSVDNTQTLVATIKVMDHHGYQQQQAPGGCITGKLSTDLYDSRMGGQIMFNAMSRAEIWLQDTLDQSLSIEDLANHLGYSASQIRRQFRHCFNTSPSAYREQRRLERAAVLLSLTPQNIAHIAIRCGYANHSSFSRAFQRRHQLTPRHYRQSFSSVRHLQ